MTYYAYVHQKQLRMIVVDNTELNQSDKVEDVKLHESTSIKATAITKLKDLGYGVISKWFELGDFTYAEVKKK